MAEQTNSWLFPNSQQHVRVMVGIHVVCEWPKTLCDFFHRDLPLLASQPSPRSFLLTSWAPSMWDHCCCCFCQVTVMLRCLELCSACFSCLYEPSLGYTATAGKLSTFFSGSVKQGWLQHLPQAAQKVTLLG